MDTPPRVHTGLNDELQKLRDNFPSKTKFVQEVKSKGICLKNGQAYGKKLPAVLKAEAALRVSKKDAKKYPLVKSMLVTVH